jgi:MFS family permease
MLPFALTFLVGSVIADGSVNRGSGASVLVLGSCICVAGFAWLAFAHTHAWQYLVGGAVIGLGCSIGYAAGFTLVQLAVPEAKAGMAAGVAGTAMAIGFAFGTALVTGLMSASVVAVAGSTTKVASQSLYGPSYWVAAVLATFVVMTVIARSRGSRRARLAQP